MQVLPDRMPAAGVAPVAPECSHIQRLDDAKLAISAGNREPTACNAELPTPQGPASGSMMGVGELTRRSWRLQRERLDDQVACRVASHNATKGVSKCQRNSHPDQRKRIE
jgi:hypothetical protein